MNKGNGNAAGGCLCPVAADALAKNKQPFSSGAGHAALEQELLARADLLQQQGVGDRRSLRRMRNRASAERSRARRHAYMNELEAEVRSLREENDHLRRLCEELKESSAAVQAPVPPVKKSKTATTTTPTPRLLLQRTSSSPF